MDKSTIIVRKATLDDAATIAQAVAMAIGDEGALRNYCGDDYTVVLTAIARREHTQYSWQYALIAECDGSPAGAIVGYDGADLYPLREGTFATLREIIGRVPTIVDETEAGEYYLDSVGVLPQFRDIGVGISYATIHLVRFVCCHLSALRRCFDFSQHDIHAKHSPKSHSECHPERSRGISYKSVDEIATSLTALAMTNIHNRHSERVKRAWESPTNRLMRLPRA